MGHFYEEGTGAPRYEVPYAGKRKGNRPATIRDAKKHGWLPSVTTILGVLDKPALTRWLVNQAIMATYGREKFSDESWDKFQRRCAKAADEVRDKAADDGSQLHDWIEKALFGKPEHPEKWQESIDAAVAYVSKYAAPHEWYIEKSFGNLGFGGRVDAFLDNGGQSIVLDWKTKEFNEADIEAGKVKGYSNHVHQLAAYANGLELGDNTIGINVFVSRTTPGLIHAYEWSVSDMQKGWEEFRAILHCYQTLNGLETTYDLK